MRVCRYAELKEAIADALCTGTFSVLVFSLKKEHQLFHRSNVRWNDFVKSYMEDAMAEVLGRAFIHALQIFTHDMFALTAILAL